MARVKRAAAVLLAAGLAAAGLPAPTAEAASTNIVISEVYGGGGNTGATWTNDFVELYNLGSSAVDVTGWSVQYASAAGTSWTATTLSGSIPAGARYLVQEGAGAAGTQNLPNPDASGSIAMSGTAGKVALVSSSGALACGATCHADPSVVDFVGYGTTASDFEGTGRAPAPSNTTSISRAATPVDTDDNAADFTTGAPSPTNKAGETTGTNATPIALAIHDVQGATHVSPYRTKKVIVSGIVTEVAPNGFFLQAPDDQADADTATSEAVFVFTSSAPTVAAGDAASVTGVVTEFRRATVNLSLTEIASPQVTVASSGNPLPSSILLGPGGRVAPPVARTDAPGDVDASTVFDPAANALDFYESMEGMRIHLVDPEVVGPNDGFGEPVIVPAGTGNRTARGGVLYNSYATQATARLVVADDIVAIPNVNVGDKFAGTVQGVLGSDFGNFRFIPATAPTRVDNGLQPEVTRADRGYGTGTPLDELSIATYNVENLDANDPDSKFASLAEGLVNNLRSPDVVALEEIQDNNGPTNDSVVAADQTLAKLIAAIQAAGGPEYIYRQVDPVDDTNGGEPGGNIRSVLLFKKMRGLVFLDRGTPSSTTGTQVVAKKNIFGKHAELTLSPGLVDPTNAAFNASRKPLVGEFSYWGKQFFVVANHFNSKGGDQPLLGRFQPPDRVTEDQRHAQATILRGFIEQIQAIDPLAAIVVVGDLNDFQFSTTADILVGANKSMSDLPRTLPANQQYTYVFQGNSQVLDHILLSKPLTFFADYDIVHINAEFAAQASDHDPQVVRLGLGNLHWPQRFTAPA